MTPASVPAHKTPPTAFKNDARMHHRFATIDHVPLLARMNR